MAEGAAVRTAIALDAPHVLLQFTVLRNDVSLDEVVTEAVLRRALTAFPAFGQLRAR
jgi:hypothetical protein